MRKFERLENSGDSDLPVNSTAVDALDIRSIVSGCSSLPPAVLRSDISYIDDRILDQETLAMLTEPTSDQSAKCLNRYQLRQRALSHYLNRRLVCVCIRLPGILYTLEIDPHRKKVIHWEWQTA